MPFIVSVSFEYSGTCDSSQLKAASWQRVDESCYLAIEPTLMRINKILDRYKLESYKNYTCKRTYAIVSMAPASTS